MGFGGFLEQIILPPGGFIFLSLLGLVLMRKTRRAGSYLATSGLILLYISSLPITANILLSWLEPEVAVTEKQITKAVDATELMKPPQVIVILGAGRHYNTLEFESDTPNEFALERIRYGVWLARRTMLPILVSGGLGDGDNLSEAEMMKQVIETEFALPVRWAETKSHNTYENAKYSTEKLKAEGIESIYLVTHAGHMKRSVMSFEKFGLAIHPAPTAFGSKSQRGISVRYFFPDSKALRRTSLVLHEWVGMIWYWARY
jgi:uncharacterized SAM-binding protein YcdF (DUF218 family)